jgi:hypothetical protein
MARKTKKIPGALVELPGRKNKGLGIITEIINQAEAENIHKKTLQHYENRPNTFARSLLSEKNNRLSQAYSFYGRNSTGVKYEKRRYAYIRWIKPPSDWNTTRINIKTDWYPLSIIRVVSEVTHGSV